MGYETVRELQGALDTEGKPVNRELYQQLWSLQEFFQAPFQAIDPNKWTKVPFCSPLILPERISYMVALLLETC